MKKELKKNHFRGVFFLFSFSDDPIGLDLKCTDSQKYLFKAVVLFKANGLEKYEFYHVEKISDCRSLRTSRRRYFFYVISNKMSVFGINLNLKES